VLFRSPSASCLSKLKKNAEAPIYLRNSKRSSM
jgi:hypothetical protein